MLEQAEAEIREAIEFHIEGMWEDGLPIPEPGSKSSTLTSRHKALHLTGGARRLSEIHSSPMPRRPVICVVRIHNTYRYTS